MPQGLDGRPSCAAAANGSPPRSSATAATGELRAASWDEALDLIAGKVTDLQASYGADSVAVFGGGGLTNEKAYQLGKFARVALGTSQIDYNGRWCMSSAASAGNQAFGVDRGLPFPLADLEQADVVVLVGSNLAETMPPAARHLDRLRERGGKLVVIDPRLTATAERADLFLQPVPGTDLALAQGALHLLDAAGAVDEEYVAARTTGWDQVRRSVASWWPERVERVTGVATAELRELVDLLATNEKVIILTARGAEQHSQGTATVLGWINVALALGLPGKDARRLRLPHRPGQRPGRARARPEGRPAPRLPDDRRPCRPRPRREGVGRRPRVAARQGRVGLRAPRVAGRRRRSTKGAAGVRQQHRRLRAAGHPHHPAAGVAGPARGLRHGHVRDRGASPTSCSRSPSGPRSPAP